MDDNQHSLDVVPSGFGHTNTGVASLLLAPTRAHKYADAATTGGLAATTTTTTTIITSTRISSSREDTLLNRGTECSDLQGFQRRIPDVDYRNYQGHNYSNKNWNQWQHGLGSTGSTGSTGSPTLSGESIHPQSDLAETHQQLQLDPSQSRWQQQQQQALATNQGPLSSLHSNLTLLQQQQQQHHQQQHADLAVAFSAYSHLHPHSNSRSHSHSHSYSESHAHPHQHHSTDQLYRAQPSYQRSSQPPRLPPLSASLSLAPIPLSLFDPFHAHDDVDHHLLSAAAPSAPATSHTPVPAQALPLPIPRLPVQTDDIVSPISETRSSSPIFRGLNRGDEPATQLHSHFHSPAIQPFPRFTPVAPPRRQPTTHSSAGASLLDDRDFERSLGAAESTEHRAASPSHSTFAAVTSAVAHDVAHLTHERSDDDWFRFTARGSSAAFGHSNSSHPEAHLVMSVAAAAATTTANMADMSSVREPLRGPSSHVSATTSSFTPLPLIHRTSGFDLLRKTGLMIDDSDTAPSPIEKDSPVIPPIAPVAPVNPVAPQPAAAIEQTSEGQLSTGQRTSQSSPQNSTQQQLLLHQQQQQLMSQQAQQQPQWSPSQQNSNAGPYDQGRSPIPPFYPNGSVAPGPAGQLSTTQPGAAQPPLTHMHPHQMMVGRGGPVGQQVKPSYMMLNGQGKQWTAQVSQLAEPLNLPHRNRAPNGQQTYPDDDEKHEGQISSPSHLGARPAQLLQTPPTRPRNASNPVPPVSSRQYPPFSNSGEQQHAFLRHQGQVPLSQHPLQRFHDGNKPRASFDDSALSKELGGRVDQVSVSSMASDDNSEGPRRGSTSIFQRGHNRNSSSLGTAQLPSTDGTPETKKKMGLFAHMAHSQAKFKSNLVLNKTSTLEEPRSDQVSIHNPGELVQGKNRLSELKGMIKGVGNAKEGTKDDHPVKVETIYESSPPLQDLSRTVTAPQGHQGAQRPLGPFIPPMPPSSFGSQGLAQPSNSQALISPHPSGAAQPMPPNPTFFAGIGRAATSAPLPNQAQPVKSEESAKKSTAVGFLGGLFHKQGNKTKDAKPQPPLQTPPLNQQPMQPPTQAGYHQLRAGQMPLPGQQLGPHPMLAGQLPTQYGPPGQSPSPTAFFQDQPPPPLETARMVSIRRPIEITVASQSQIGTSQPSAQRPSLPSPQGSQGAPKPQAILSSLGQRTGQAVLQNGSAVVSQTSPQASEDSFFDKPTMPNASTLPRNSPNRKPVGSGISKGNGPFMTSAIAPATSQTDRPTASPSPSPRSGEQRTSSQLSQTQQTLQLRSSEGYDDSRQSLAVPSSEPSPAPSQSNRSSSPRIPGDQFTRTSPDPRASGQSFSLFPNGLTPPGNVPNGTAWGQNGPRPAGPPLLVPPAASRTQPPRAPSSPIPDQNKLSKFFGAYDGGKPAAQPQAAKEKSAASKFLGAFRRSAKQNDSPPPSQSRPQTSPQAQHPPQQGMQSVVPNQATTGGAIPPLQTGQGRGIISPSIPPQQFQAGRGQPGQLAPGQISPGVMAIPPPAGRGQLPPGMTMQGGRGQVPSSVFAGGGPVPPQIQQRSAATGKQGEPQYDQVPIPRGYEAVHGYGPGFMLAPSPYNAGRPGHPPMQFAQHPAALQSGGFPQRPWDPRVMQPLPGGLPPGVALQAMPQGMAGMSPQQLQQYQGQMALTSSIPGNPLATLAQGQLPPQQLIQQQQQQHLLQQRQLQLQLQMQQQQQQSVQQPGQLMPPGQNQVSAQLVTNPQLQQGSLREQEIQRESSPASQVQANDLSWAGTPQPSQSPLSFQHQQQQHKTLPQNLAPQTQNVQTISVSNSTASNRTVSAISPHSQLPTSAIMAPPSHPPQLMAQSNTSATGAHQTTPVNRIVIPTMEQSQTSSSTSTSGSANESPLIRSPDAATRLTSRMSVSKLSMRSMDRHFGSPASEKPPRMTHDLDRELGVVSPQQQQQQNLSVNVDRSNHGHARHGSEDIYDATPRLNNAHSYSPSLDRRQQGQISEEATEDPTHENTKYAAAATGIGLGVGAGTVIAGSEKDAALPEDNRSFLIVEPDSSGSDSDEDEDDYDHNAVTVGRVGIEQGEIFRNGNQATTTATAVDSAPEQQATSAMATPIPTPTPTPAPAPIAVSATEPEEKIPVDQPVELAAVNDRDDGLPMMSATSYPGQEWNPYEAGEFGDWNE